MDGRIGGVLLALGISGFAMAAASGRPAPVAPSPPAAVQSGVNDAAILGDGYPARLSDYGFFTDLTARAPAPRVIGYTLPTPLFSDYTQKERMVYVPPGTSARYTGTGAFEFPTGSALIKSFGYGKGAAFRPIETRVLLRRASGWVALPYVWNAQGTDALIRRAGTRVPVTFTDDAGKQRQISYAVPNQNQCKDCHSLSGQITPIGMKAHHLNHGDQLAVLVRTGLLDRVARDAPRAIKWDNPRTPINARARAYLDINCAHCHNPAGGAANSGLFLEWDRTDPIALGIGKRPVAAGRGSGGRAFSITPGDAAGSILIYRLASTDPGIAMPELGRATAHDEGIALLSTWINTMASPAR